MSQDSLDITPDPKVLIALTHTPIRPLDSLCELVDNGIDSFRAAMLQGSPVTHPLLELTVPGAAEARRGEGVIRIVDNGAGLDRDGLADALRAGFSGKNRYDTLGLFGMGFNIATGKLGRETTVTTARREDDKALRVVIDLPTVVKNRRFEVPVELVDKPQNFQQGTIVEVSHWWPEGDPNAGFIIQLAQIAKPQLRLQMGRRYASILRSDDAHRVRIMLNGESVQGFEHCVWDDSRFVERQGWGLIPARFDIDEVIHIQRRCVNDGTTFDEGSDTCLECDGAEFRTIEERIRGWVGVQRYDDNNTFGIDLIRNGRAIRVSEQQAFFYSVDELGQPVKEYPTDQQTGRLVGEIQLDQVPVDFQKQDFQRSSEEWQRAMAVLRGGSLLPSKWKKGERNETPVSKLFQGFRKVRNPGRQDMYMGRWDEATRKAVRVGREVEAEMYERFLDKEEGYYDDARWWELVETATIPPVLPMEECLDCGFQNRLEDDTCGDCGRLIHSKDCIECTVEIARSAIVCSACGASQIPEVLEPWACEVCSDTNGIDDESCGTCESLRGTQNPMAESVLREGAESIEHLSFDARAFTMADGRVTEPLAMNAFRTATLRPKWDGDPVPTVAFRSAGSTDVFIDTAHPSFIQMGVLPEQAIAVEAAQYLYNLRSDLAGRPAHSVQNIATQVLANVWGEQLAVGPEQVGDMIRHLFARIAERLESNADAADFYNELDSFEERELADKLIGAGNLDQLPALRSTGSYFQYAGVGVMARFFSFRPESWFGTVWTEQLPDAAKVGEAAKSACEQIIGMYRRCLEDCAAFLRFPNSDLAMLTRAQASQRYLEDRLA